MTWLYMALIAFAVNIAMLAVVAAVAVRALRRQMRGMLNPFPASAQKAKVTRAAA